MRRFQVTIDMGNAAFEDDECGELAAILHRIARQLTDGDNLDTYNVLRDTNGNTVGEIVCTVTL